MTGFGVSPRKQCITFLLFELTIQKGSSSDWCFQFISMQTPLKCSYWLFVVFYLTSKSHQSRLHSFASITWSSFYFSLNLLLLVFLLHALFLSLYSSQTFGQKWSSFIFYILCFFLISPLLLPVSYTFKLFHSYSRLFCSHSLLFFNLHAPYFCHPFSPPFFLQIFSFSLQSFYRCPSHSIQIKEYHFAI